MLIHEEDGYRVLQHAHLDIFNIQTYGECDNPRSYGRHNDWYTVKQVRGIKKVNQWFADNIWNK